MLAEVRFEIPGTPMGRTNPFAVKGNDGSVRLVQSHVTRTYEGLVAMACHEAFRGVPQISEACVVDILALFPRPQDMVKDLRYPDGIVVVRDRAKKPDRDNIEKAIQDGLKGRWTDDHLVVMGTTVKAYCERYGTARTIVSIRPVSGLVEFLGYPIEVMSAPAKRTRKVRATRAVATTSDDVEQF